MDKLLLRGLEVYKSLNLLNPKDHYYQISLKRLHDQHQEVSKELLEHGITNFYYIFPMRDVGFEPRHPRIHEFLSAFFNAPLADLKQLYDFVVNKIKNAPSLNVISDSKQQLEIIKLLNLLSVFVGVLRARKVKFESECPLDLNKIYACSTPSQVFWGTCVHNFQKYLNMLPTAVVPSDHPMVWLGLPQDRSWNGKYIGICFVLYDVVFLLGFILQIRSCLTSPRPWSPSFAIP